MNLCTYDGYAVVLYWLWINKMGLLLFFLLTFLFFSFTVRRPGPWRTMGARAAATSPRFVVCKKHGERGTHAGGSQNPRASSNQPRRTASARLRPDSGRGGQIVGGGFAACDADGEYEKKNQWLIFFKKNIL